ncbi:DMT family transporter [Leeia oryzae]|uniref:DMT family transporter n=1 Tax=Leeia oryzae TaxID=356662 RepID=UPI0003829DF4|nr:DMT family transporter [Leeia oryzae]
MQLSSHRSAYVLLVLTTLFWSGNFVLARALHNSIPPVALSFWRWCIAGAILAPFVWPRFKSALPELRQIPGKLWLLTLTGVAGYNTLAYLGLQQTTATNAGLLNAFIPILILLFGAIAFKHRLGWLAIAGITVSLLGVMMIVSKGDVNHLLNVRLNMGDGWVILAGVAWAIYTLTLRHIPPTLDRMALLLATILLGCAVLLPFYLLEYMHAAHIAGNLANLAGLAYVGTFPSIIAYLFYTLAVSRLGAPKAGQFIHLMPVFVPLLSILFLGEQFHPYHLAGILAIFAGIAITSRAH